MSWMLLRVGTGPAICTKSTAVSVREGYSIDVWPAEDGAARGEGHVYERAGVGGASIQ